MRRGTWGAARWTPWPAVLGRPRAHRGAPRLSPRGWGPPPRRGPSARWGAGGAGRPTPRAAGGGGLGGAPRGAGGGGGGGAGRPGPGGGGRPGVLRGGGGVGGGGGPRGRGARRHGAALVHRSQVPGPRLAPTRSRRSAADVPP